MNPQTSLHYIRRRTVATSSPVRGMEATAEGAGFAVCALKSAVPASHADHVSAQDRND